MTDSNEHLKKALAEKAHKIVLLYLNGLYGKYSVAGYQVRCLGLVLQNEYSGTPDIAYYRVDLEDPLDLFVTVTILNDDITIQTYHPTPKVQRETVYYYNIVDEEKDDDNGEG